MSATFTQPFPNGSSLNVQAFSPHGLQTFFQNIIAMILGYDTSQPAIQPVAWNAVRVSWPPKGQPAWDREENICFLRAYPEGNNPYGENVAFNYFVQNDYASLAQVMSYTQVWDLHIITYGPKSHQAALKIAASFFLDWVHDLLAPLNLFAIVGWKRPQYFPELFKGQWWKRCDLHIGFNEAVQLNTTVPAAASIGITLVTDTGLSETIEVETDPLSWAALTPTQWQNLTPAQWQLLNP